jgi:hypothetical protein
LDLVDNPVEKMEEYRKFIFKMMKNLTVLDGYNKEGELQYYEFYEDDILHPSKISRHTATLSKVSDSEEEKDIIDVDLTDSPRKKVLK